MSIKKEFICEDQKDLPEEQWALLYSELPYGDKLTMTSLDINLSCEILHNLFGQMYITYSNISDENELRTADYQLRKNYFYGISFGYGF